MVQTKEQERSAWRNNEQVGKKKPYTCKTLSRIIFLTSKKLKLENLGNSLKGSLLSFEGQ